MQSVFLDANIFFAAVRSSWGGSYFVIELAKRKQVRVVTVAHALAEAERNIAEKLGGDTLNFITKISSPSDRRFDHWLATRGDWSGGWPRRCPKKTSPLCSERR